MSAKFTLGKVTVGQVTFGQVTFGQMTISHTTVDLMTARQLTVSKVIVGLMSIKSVLPDDCWPNDFWLNNMEATIVYKCKQKYFSTNSIFSLSDNEQVARLQSFAWLWNGKVKQKMNGKRLALTSDGAFVVYVVVVARKLKLDLNSRILVMNAFSSATSATSWASVMSWNHSKGKLVC